MLSILIFSGNYINTLSHLKSNVTEAISQFTPLKILFPVLVSESMWRWIPIHWIPSYFGGGICLAYELLCTTAIFMFLFAVYLLLRWIREEWGTEYIYSFWVVNSIILTILILFQINTSLQVTYRDEGDKFQTLGKFVDVGRYARKHLPQNSALFLESGGKIDNLFLMLDADRSSYRVKEGTVMSVREEKRMTLKEAIQIVKRKGGIPYLVSSKVYQFPLIYKSPISPDYKIYELSSNEGDDHVNFETDGR